MIREKFIALYESDNETFTLLGSSKSLSLNNVHAEPTNAFLLLKIISAVLFMVTGLINGSSPWTLTITISSPISNFDAHS